MRWKYLSLNSQPHKLGSICYFIGYGNEVADNFLKDNGFFGNVTNGDLADGHIASTPGNCWHGNHDPHGVTSAPANIQATLGTCGVTNQGDPTVQAVGLCESGFDPQACATLPPLHFPTETAPVLLPIPREQSMPDPCAGVPANPWCEQASQSNQGNNAWLATSTWGALTVADLTTLAAARKRSMLS